MISKFKIQTQKFAMRLANKLLKAAQPHRSGRSVGATIICLHGDLGAGKTTFVQGFMKALGVKQRVTSPTFLIIRKYQLKGQGSKSPCLPAGRKGQMFNSAYHLDLYRIQKSKELLDLGFRKIIQDPHAIVLIEWPERVKKLLPKNLIWIVLEHGKKENERIINVL